MATLNIEGRKITVDDGFLKLSPDEQNATVEEIAKSLGAGGGQQVAPTPAPPAAQPAPVVSQPSGGGFSDTVRSIRDAIHAPTRVLENGFLFGLGDRARAGMDAIIGAGGYGDNLKREQAETERFQAAHPVLAPVIEGVGNITTPLGVIGAAARGTTLGAKMLYGAGAGAGMGTLQGAAGSKDWTNVPQTAMDAGIGGGTGFVVGGAFPGAARVIGAGYNRLTNAITGNAAGMSRGASRHLVNAMEVDTPAAVQARLAELGPDAMLADAGPAFLGKAQGASLNSDEGRSILQTALTDRNVGTNQRIMGDVNRALGPAEDPQTVTNTIRAVRAEQDAQNYGQALMNSPLVDTRGVLADLGAQINNSAGIERQALTNLRDMLMRRLPGGATTAETNPVVLHKIKGELDSVIQYDQPGLGIPGAALSQRNGTLQRMRFLLNEALEDQVPGYARANAASAALARRGEAVQLGTQYLGAGKTTASPERFAHEFEQLVPGEQIAFAKGSRGEIERKLGTKANDLQALRTELQGEGGWNTAKLATVHGEPSAQELISSVNRNLAYRDTYNKVVENSQTAQRLAAKEAMNPTPAGETAIINPNMTVPGFLLAGAKKGLGAAYGALKPSETRAYGEIAEILSARGARRDASTQAIIDALERRRGNAVTASAAGDRAALIAAIAAHGYARNNPKRNRDK